MKVGRERKKRIDIADSGALSDLAFLLIIFFIVIAVFNVNEGFMLGIPRKDSTKILNTEDILRIELARDGSLINREEPISFDRLQDLISDRLSSRPNMTLLLSIHPDTPYQFVVDIVELVRSMRVDNFSFRMEEIES